MNKKKLKEVQRQIYETYYSTLDSFYKKLNTEGYQSIESFTEKEMTEKEFLHHLDGKLEGIKEIREILGI